MKKINQIATINDVSLNDKLKGWNEDNDAFRYNCVLHTPPKVQKMITMKIYYR